jgi:hypothetical protein
MVCFMSPTTRMLMGIATISLGATLVAQGFNLMTGRWQLTLRVDGTVPTAGGPPESRAQTEVQVKKPRTFTRCVTADDVKTLNLVSVDDSDEKDCRIVKSTITSTVADITRACAGEEPHTETAHFEAATPQTLRATITSTRGLDTLKTSITGKWIAANCLD